MNKKRVLFGVMSSLLLISLLLTGCLGGGVAENPGKDVADAVENMVGYWYQDVEKYADFFKYPMEVDFYVWDADAGETTDWWYEEIERAEFIEHLKSEWPAQDASYIRERKIV